MNLFVSLSTDCSKVKRRSKKKKKRRKSTESLSSNSLQTHFRHRVPSLENIASISFCSSPPSHTLLYGGRQSREYCIVSPKVKISKSQFQQGFFSVLPKMK